MNSENQAAAAQRHPKGLYVLFGTEMWERFCFYGAKALLVFYMTSVLAFPQEKASSIYGWYMGAVYLTPFFGGMIADRWLGQRRAVFIGGILMAAGEFVLMSKSLFFPGLGLVALGNGLLKPNISTQVGSLYGPNDSRRDRAYSIFYFGINMGASLAPFVAGTLGEKVDFRLGFAASGIGVLIGLAIYFRGQRHLAPDLKMRKAAGEVSEAKPLTRDEIRRVVGLSAVCLLNIVFWAAYEQSGNTLALWARDYTDRHVFGWVPAAWADGGSWLAALRGWEIPATWFQSINPVLILALTPFVTVVWAWQSRRGTEPNSVTKMGLGSVFLGIGFLLMFLGARAIAGGGGLASSWWLVGYFALATVGELYLSPIGLSTVTKVAPPRLVSTLMGVWFLSLAMGDYLAGFVGTYWNRLGSEGFFLLLFGLCLAAGFAIFALSRPLLRAMERPETPALAAESPAP